MQSTNEKQKQKQKQKTSSKPNVQKESSPCLESSVTVDCRSEYSSLFKWVAPPDFENVKAKTLYSPYFEVGGFDFRFLIYPKGDSLSLPGHISLYLQINDPRGSFDCCASYKITIVNFLNDNKSLFRESCYRFSKTRKSIGWSEFAVSKTVLDPASGFLTSSNGSLLITLDIHVLNETKTLFSDDCNETNNSFVLDGRVTWTIRNYSLFKDIIKTHKLISFSFQVGEGNLRIYLYRTVVDGVEYLSLFLDTKDTEKCTLFGRSFWGLFRISVLNQNPAGFHVHRDTQGRFSVSSLSRDDTTLGWTQYMKMSDFTCSNGGFLVDDSVVIGVSFHSIRESSIVLNSGNLFRGKSIASLFKKGIGCSGKFLWKIENFVRLKNILKKNKHTGLCVKSRTFRVGNMNFRLLIYPRGKSQKPFHLSLFLEVLDPGNTSSDWSSFIMYRLVVMNQKMIDKSIIRESQDRCSKATQHWGWTEFMTLTSFFDQDLGYLDKDTAVFTAEVRVLKETFILKSINESSNKKSCTDTDGKRCSVTWKVENFSSLKDIMVTGKIFCKLFQVGGCMLRIGFYESSENIFAYLERDSSVSNDPDENFWVSYRIALVNQKDPAKSLWKESSLCTKSRNRTHIQFMKVSDMVEEGAGFVVHEMAIFTCEILDCCPWFDFSGAELLAMDNGGDDSSHGINELYNLEDRKMMIGKRENFFNLLLISARCNLTDEDAPRQLLVKLKELLRGTGAVAGLLAGIRCYLDDPVKVKRLFPQAKKAGSNGGKKYNEADESSAMLTNTTTAIRVLQQTINDTLLDIMIECCQPSNNSIDDIFAASSKPSAYDNPAVCQPESQCDIRYMVSMQSSLFEGSRNGVTTTSGTCAAECSVVEGDDIFKNTIFEQCALHLETSTSSPIPMAKLTEPSEEVLQLIVMSLKTLDGPVPQVHPKPRQRLQSAEKVFFLLEKAPTHLLPDLVVLLPKLLNNSEHPLVAFALLDHLTRLDAELALQPPALATISQLNLDNEGWKRTICQASQLLGESNGEVLGATIDFLLKAASRCQHIPQAVRAVLARLESLGTKVSSYVLDLLSKTVNSQHDIAESMLREIGSVFALDGNCLTNPSRLFLDQGRGPQTNCFHLVDEPLKDANRHFSDIFLLISMLTIPSLAGEASQVLERGIAHGFIDDRSVAIVLEKYTQRYSLNLEPSTYGHQVTEIEKKAESFCLEGVFTSVLALARKLSLAENSRVHGFVKMFYLMLFGLFSSESYHRSMLKGLVDLATNPADGCSEINLDILIYLIQERQGFARPVLSMMKNVAQDLRTDNSTTQHRLCTIKEDLLRAREEKKDELSKLSAEKAILLERLTQSEGAILHYKSEMKITMDRFACEKKELCGYIKSVESELEQVSSQQHKKVMKLSRENKDYQDRLHHVETQLSQLKSGKRHEMKKLGKENKVLTERLKHVEAEREIFDRELKRYAVDVVAQEEGRQKLMNEIRQLKHKLQQIGGVKQEKEEEVAHCRAYTQYIEAKLHSCQQNIHSLENALQEEMLQHAPLYGVGLEDLSMKELETLSRIHEDGLKEIRYLQHRSGSPRGNHVSSIQKNIHCRLHSDQLDVL